MIKGVILELNAEENIYALLLFDGNTYTVLPSIKEDEKYMICTKIFARGDFSVLTKHFDQVEELDPMEAEIFIRHTKNANKRRCTTDEELLKEVLEELFEFTIQQLEEV